MYLTLFDYYQQYYVNDVKIELTYDVALKNKSKNSSQLKIEYIVINVFSIDPFTEIYSSVIIFYNIVVL